MSILLIASIESMFYVKQKTRFQPINVIFTVAPCTYSNEHEGDKRCSDKVDVVVELFDVRVAYVALQGALLLCV